MRSVMKYILSGLCTALLVIGTAGCLFCFLGARSWKKRRPE